MKRSRDVYCKANKLATKTMGKEAKNVLVKLKRGDKDALFRIKQNVKTDDKFQLPILRTKLVRNRTVRTKLVEIRV